MEELSNRKRSIGRRLVPALAVLVAALSCIPEQSLASVRAVSVNGDSFSTRDLPPALPPSLLESSQPERGKSGGLCGGTDYCWDDGGLSQTYLPNGGGIGGTSLVSTYAGYLISDDGNWPATGDTYWAHIVTAVSVIRLSSIVTGVEFARPPHTAFALDSAKPYNAGKIRCYWTQYTSNGSGGFTPGSVREFTGSNDGAGNACLTQPSLSGFGQTLGWSEMLGTLDSYSLFEVVVPLRSSRPLYGIASSTDKMRSRVSFNIEADLYPEAWTIVSKSNISLSPRSTSRGVSLTGKVGPVDPLRGALSASGEGEKVEVKLFAVVGGRSKLAGTKSLTLAPNGGFSTSIPVPRAATRCTVRATWGGTTTSQKTISC